MLISAQQSLSEKSLVGFSLFTFKLEDEIGRVAELLTKISLEALIRMWGFSVMSQILVVGRINDLIFAGSRTNVMNTLYCGDNLYILQGPGAP